LSLCSARLAGWGARIRTRDFSRKIATVFQRVGSGFSLLEIAIESPVVAAGHSNGRDEHGMLRRA
jgi:hypothetical protein